MNKNNTSGEKGVQWDKRARRWVVSIMFNREVIYKAFKEKQNAISFAKEVYKNISQTLSLSFQDET
jgi:hypothetical protein